MSQKRVIIVNSFDTFEYRVLLLKEVLKKQGYRVLIVGSDYRHIEKTVRESQDPELHLLHAKPYQKNISVARITSHMKFARDAYEYIKDMEAELLYLVIPPNSQGTIAGKYLKKHPHTKVLMDLIDLWPESFPSTHTERFPFTLWGKVRNDNLQYAHLILTECDLYREKLEKYLTGKKVETLYWAHEDSKISYEAPKEELPTDKWVLGYLGSVNHIIDLEKIEKVIEFFKKDRGVELHIVGAGESLGELQKVCENAGAKVIYHGKIYDYEEKKAIFDRCHFGLNLMKDTVVVGLSMKSIDYMEMGLPMINSLKGDSEKFVAGQKMGYNLNAMEHRYENEFRANARRFFEENCSYHAFEKKVEEILEKIHS